MRFILSVLALVLLLGGCAAKIAPGHIDKTEVQKATPQMSQEPEPIKPKAPEQKVSMPEIEAESNVTSAVIPQEEETTFEETEEEIAKPRFPRSQMLESSPYKVTMKTKKFAFSDTGFLNRYDNLINLQVFTMGELTLDLVVYLNKDEICTGTLCNSKHGFNQTFLSGEYPDTLIENVLQSKPIFGGKGLKKMTKGFVQKIIGKKYAIKYKIWPGNVYFKDVKNGIIIKLRKLPK